MSACALRAHHPAQPCHAIHNVPDAPHDGQRTLTKSTTQQNHRPRTRTHKNARKCKCIQQKRTRVTIHIDMQSPPSRAAAGKRVRLQAWVWRTAAEQEYLQRKSSRRKDQHCSRNAQQHLPLSAYAASARTRFAARGRGAVQRNHVSTRTAVPMRSGAGGGGGVRSTKPPLKQLSEWRSMRLLLWSKSCPRPELCTCG